MHRKLIVATIGFALAVLPAMQASADCKGDVEGIETKIKQAKVRETYKGREAEHPEVLIMSDGRLVDLTGYIIVDPSVQESWLGDRPVVEQITPMIAEAKGFADKKQDADCMGVYEKIQGAINGSSGG